MTDARIDNGFVDSLAFDWHSLMRRLPIFRLVCRSNQSDKKNAHRFTRRILCF